MTLVKQPLCNAFKIESLVKSFVPLAEKVANIGMELSFILPTKTASEFPNLFDKLESKFNVVVVYFC